MIAFTDAVLSSPIFISSTVLLVERLKGQRARPESFLLRPTRHRLLHHDQDGDEPVEGGRRYRDQGLCRYAHDVVVVLLLMQLQPTHVDASQPNAVSR